jgi:hypothetical protein
MVGGTGDTLQRPTHRQIRQHRAEHHSEDDGCSHPRVRHECEHGAHIRNEPEVPVQIDPSPVERADGHIDIPTDDQRDPEDSQTTHSRAKRRTRPAPLEPAPTDDEAENADCQLDGDVPAQANGQRRPDVVERQRCVQRRNSNREKSPTQYGSPPGRFAPHFLYFDSVSGSLVPPMASASRPPMTGSP